MSHFQLICPYFTPGRAQPWFLRQPPAAQRFAAISPGQTGPAEQWAVPGFTQTIAQLYCSGCDQPNKASTADFNHYLIVIFASQFREMGTIFSTLHLIDTLSPFVFCFQLQAIKAFLASHNNCIKRPLHNHTITLFIALPSSISFIWLQSSPTPKKC